MKKKIVDEAKEVLDALGGEDDKAGRDAAFAYGEAIEESYDQERVREKELLSYQKSTNKYKDGLAMLLRERLATIFWPKGYNWITARTEKGVALEFKTPQGRSFAQGITPTFDLEYDLNALDVLTLRAENTILRLHGEQAGIDKPDS